MALKKANTFEQENMNTETAVAEKPTEVSSAVQASVAIAKASTSAVAAKSDAATAAKNFKKEVEAMQDAADFSYGAMRCFKASNGAIREMSGDKLILGKWVKGRMLAWGRHWEISPGETGKSSVGFVAYAKDGVTIDYVIGEEMKSWEGRSVADYLDHLRTVEGFSSAGKREFIDCQVAAMGSDEEPDFKGVIQITLSSSSIPSFRKYQTELEATARCVSMGLPGYELPEDPLILYFIREDASKGSNSWTKLRLSSTLPAKV